MLQRADPATDLLESTCGQLASAAGGTGGDRYLAFVGQRFAHAGEGRLRRRVARFDLVEALAGDERRIEGGIRRCERRAQAGSEGAFVLVAAAQLHLVLGQACAQRAEVQGGGVHGGLWAGLGRLEVIHGGTSYGVVDPAFPPRGASAKTTLSQASPSGGAAGTLRKMPLRKLVPLVLLTGLFVALAGACGDRSEEPAPASVVPTRSTSLPTATVPRSEKEVRFGPEPKLGGNILELAPGWGQLVRQEQTRSPNAGNPKGVCIKVSFDGTPEYGQWFRLAIDGAEVTAEKYAVWIIGSREQPRDGIFCYAPPEGFPVGVHAAAISVQNPRNPQEPTKQIVAWKFEVTP